MQLPAVQCLGYSSIKLGFHADFPLPSRSVLYPSDLVKFDVLVSPHEVEALHWRASEYGDVEGPDEGSCTARDNILQYTLPSQDDLQTLLDVSIVRSLWADS